MGLNDLILTPLFLLLLCVGAYWLRPFFVTSETKRYFLPALLLKFFAAIFIGLLYQFYYSGGDTFNYFHHSGVIYDAFHDDFLQGIYLIGRHSNAPNLAFDHFQKLYWFYDPPSYFVSQIAAIFDLFTFHTYSSTALFFALFSFSGCWSLFKELNKKYPGNTKTLAICILFFPSVLVWGSGILKDTLALSSTFWIVSLFSRMEGKRLDVWSMLLLVLFFFILYKVKVYVLIVLMPCLLFWRMFRSIQKIRNVPLRVMIAPFIISIFGYSAYLSATQMVSEESKYSLGRIAQTTQITSYDIGFYTGSGAGSSYSLGELDGTIGSMVSKAPLSIITSLFRPFLWEVRNPLMLLSSLEGLVMILVTLYSFRKGIIQQNLKDPFLISCLIFSIVFAFSVGFSYNFGTLVRYRIPMIAFYLIPMLIKKNIAS